MSVKIDCEVPEDVHRRLKILKTRRGLTWKGLLVYAADELADDVEVEA